MLYLSSALADAVRGGTPWLMAHAIEPSSALTTAPPGSLVTLADKKGRPLAVAYYHPRSKIACRVLSLNPKETIDRAFFIRRLRAALERREKMFDAPYYRLVHAESDGLPGLVIDRFDDALVCQVGTAGMERLFPLVHDALEEIFRPRVILLRNDIPARAKEGLAQEVRLIQGALGGPVEVKQGAICYLADLERGQKTGWFFDQRDNHAHMASFFLAPPACGGSVLEAGNISQTSKYNTPSLPSPASGGGYVRMLDVYSYVGGFGIAAAVAGAREVTMVDSSAPALALARQAAALNGVEGRCAFIEGKAYDVLERLANEGRRFDVVNLDPPAFAKTRRDLPAALKGYEKLVRLAAPLVAEEGILFIASCSHHVARAALQKAALAGLAHAGKKAEVLRVAGAAPDHPVHPHLPETDYLKAVTVRVA